MRGKWGEESSASILHVERAKNIASGKLFIPGRFVIAFRWELIS
ncbi:hypothetical protein [Peribacillus butanolivorans]